MPEEPLSPPLNHPYPVATTSPPRKVGSCLEPGIPPVGPVFWDLIAGPDLGAGCNNTQTHGFLPHPC